MLEPDHRCNDECFEGFEFFDSDLTCRHGAMVHHCSDPFCSYQSKGLLYQEVLYLLRQVNSLKNEGGGF